MKERIKEDKEAIKSIYKIFKENIKKPFESLEFVIVLLLIIDGKMELSRAQSTFLKWYNGGKNE